MNLTEMSDAVAMIGIPERVVALGGHADNAWCLEQATDGMWDVYWSERGGKHDLVRLRTESDACHQLLGRLTYTQLLAGAIRLS